MSVFRDFSAITIPRMKEVSESMGNEIILKTFREALSDHRRYLISYERPSEVLTFETLRVLDDLHCRELMEPSRLISEDEKLFRGLSTWGINHALRRIIPKTLKSEPFRYFPSTVASQKPANDFVFNCGVLAVAERLEGWLQDGLLHGDFGTGAKGGIIERILVLRSRGDSCFDESIGRLGLRWASTQTWNEDREEELELETRHRQFESELHRRVKLINGCLVDYSSTPEIDRYFLDWARLYLRRIFSQDMVGPDDVIGGKKFSEYLAVLSAVSAFSQRHIAYAAIIRAHHHEVDFRNLITSFCPRHGFTEVLAELIGSDTNEIAKILSSLTLSADNLDAHTIGSAPAWAPIVQASQNTFVLPAYGLEINPFLFLLSDLRFRYETDWFKIANNREGRWISELKEIFPAPRWKTSNKHVRLREAGKELTDIDFAAFDIKTGQLALFQLKWQHPVGIDNRGRRSSGKNLVQDCNRWINTVENWLTKHGSLDIMQRLGLECHISPDVRLFVLGRYNVHFSGFDERDERATWSDWAHFQRAIGEGAQGISVRELATRIHVRIERSRSRKQLESMAFPLGSLAVIVNPTSTPKGRSRANL